MGDTAYLMVMLGVIALLVTIIVPSLFLRKCPHCGSRAFLDAAACPSCGRPFPSDE